MHIYISHHARASPFSSLRRSARHNFREKSTCVSQERNTSAFWYARLDSNQRPLESELSGCQAANRCGTMVWWELHKFPPLWRKTSEALSGRASEVFHGSSQIVVCAPRRSYDSVQLSTPTPVSYCTKTAYPARLRCGSELRSVGCVGRRSSTSGSPCPLRSGRTSRRYPLQPSPHGA